MRRAPGRRPRHRLSRRHRPVACARAAVAAAVCTRRYFLTLPMASVPFGLLPDPSRTRSSLLGLPLSATRPVVTVTTVHAA